MTRRWWRLSLLLLLASAPAALAQCPLLCPDPCPPLCPPCPPICCTGCLPNVTFTLAKDAEPDGSQPFTFTGGVAATLVDDGGGDSLTVTFPQQGTFVTEQVPAGWVLADLHCEGIPGGFIDRGAATVQVVAASGQGGCRFLDVQQPAAGRGTVVVNLDAQPDGSQVFTFGGDLGAFMLAEPSIAADASAAFFDLAPGTYSVAVAPVPGWETLALHCFDPDGGSLGNPITGTATFDVDPGEVVTCRFEIAQRGSITLVLEADPETPQEFAFDGPDPLDAVLVDDGSGRERVTFGDLRRGAYVFFQALPPGWRVTQIDCGETLGITSDLTLGGVLIRLMPGADVTCVFRNRFEGTAFAVPGPGPAGLAVLALLLAAGGTLALRRFDPRRTPR